MTEFTIHARWIAPVSRSPIENGRLTFAGGRIVAVESGSRQPQDVDYGDAMVLPGLVNAHTHLELTHLRGRVPFAGSFTAWLAGVVALQTTMGANEAMGAATRDGLAESLAAGVATVVDIGCGEWTTEPWLASPVNLVCLFEAIGMGPRRLLRHHRSIDKAIADHQAADRAQAANDGLAAESVCRKFGISPHAPYSTAPEVYQQAVQYVQSRGLPFCTHLAETRDELEFLARGTGAFRELLEFLGLWDGSFTPPGCSPIQYAERLGLLQCRPILAHVNYVSDSDIDRLAPYEASVVYCPRTHRFFGHEPHRFREMLARGINVCLGTDSLASTESLSILDELRFLRQIEPAVPSEVLLEMGTIRGARAAGLQNETGSLEPGKRADLIVVPIGTKALRDPVEHLLLGSTRPIAAYVGGHVP
jgi:aminodeoxyfutalosine deaminase